MLVVMCQMVFSLTLSIITARSFHLSPPPPLLVLCTVVLIYLYIHCFGSTLSFNNISFTLQIKLLKIMALLGSGDKQASEQMYTVVGDIMRKSDTTSNIGNAILYECICCASSIHPSPKLLEAAADAIAKFLKVCLLDWSRIFDKHLFA